MIDVMFRRPGQPTGVYLEDGQHELTDNGKIAVKLFSMMIDFYSAVLFPNAKAKVNDHVPACVSKESIAKAFTLVEPLGFARLV